MDLPDLDEIDPDEIEPSIENKAKKSAKVCGQCGEEIGEPVFFVTKHMGRGPFGNLQRRRVPACADCGRDNNQAVRFDTEFESVSRAGIEWTRELKQTHAEAECAGCGRTCILDRDRHKFEKSWLTTPSDMHRDASDLQRKTFCSQRCRVQHNNQKRSERLEKKRAGTECQQCGDTFTPDRSDAKYCSSACKQRAYRRRKKSET